MNLRYVLCRCHAAGSRFLYLCPLTNVRNRGGELARSCCSKNPCFIVGMRFLLHLLYAKHILSSGVQIIQFLDLSAHRILFQKSCLHSFLQTSVWPSIFLRDQRFSPFTPPMKVKLVQSRSDCRDMYFHINGSKSLL